MKINQICQPWVFLGLIALAPSTAMSNTHVDGQEKKIGVIKRPSKDRPAFFKLVSGVAFSQNANISADPIFWDPAVEGYNSRLGTGGMIGAGFGYAFNNWFSGGVTLLHQTGFKYDKFQTAIPGAGTVGALPDKTRHFKLASTSVMFDGRLHGKGLGFSHTLHAGRDYIAPFLGGGLGFTYHKMSNFYSSLAPTALTTPSPSAASMAPDATTSTTFTYQLEAGVEYHYDNTWRMSAGYRWFDAGEFSGPKTIIIGTGLPGNPLVGAIAPPWKGTLRAHQLFAEVAYHF